MRSFAFALLALLAAPPADAQETGRLEGTATISNRLTAQRTRGRVYDEPGGMPTHPITDENRFGSVVLYLQSTSPLRGRAQASAPEPVMRQSGERFLPHILPVPAGTSVAFPNDDPIYHKVFSLSRVKAFDLGRYPRGQSKSVLFARPGVVQVFCHIHADMSGFILVLDNPFYVVPDAQGRFALEGIPPGEYQLVAWHERIRPVLTPVRIEAGRTASLSLRIPLPDAGENP